MECVTSPNFSQLSLYTKGTRIWIPCSREVWQEAEIVEQLTEERTLKVKPLHTQEELTICVTDQTNLPHLKNPEALLGDSDLASLAYLHEPDVLSSLELRYVSYNLIYTWCGIVLIAINPYQEVPLYAGDVARAYSQLSPGGPMDPHVFAVSEEARRRMSVENRDQSIIVTGESGAGKTVSACYVMRYFADVTAVSGELSLENRVLACNPLLEAFGNAKTIRNDNSSRFGKYIELCFDGTGGLNGARLNTYLLEKTRVVQQSSAERNYHIFYQLCAGRTRCPLLKSSLLSASSSYSYLTGGGSMAHAIHRDDIGDLDRTLEAMSLLGLSDLQVSQVLSLLSGILHLGNIEITANEGEEAALQLTSRPLINCATLWGVPPARLSRGILQRQIATSRDYVIKSLTQREAISCRDGFAKFLYGQLFRWLVSVINDTLSPPGPTGRTVGVLDIYGFESLEINSFEQLCINYANEKLQLLFTEHVFRLEQEEYLREGIHWSYIPFSDNVPTLQLIETHLGILDLLDESCQMPRSTDENWAQKLHSQQSRHARYQRPKSGGISFRVFHYAGWVEYQAAGFLDKNRDPVAADLVSLLRDSSCPLVCELGECAEVSGGPRGSRRTSFRTHTVANQFRRSLTELVDKLRHTTSHYIRCIKPNSLKQAFSFDSRQVVSQLRACGVIDTVRISAEGFPSRLSYSDFLSRYSLLTDPLADRLDPKQTSSRLLATLLKNPETYQLGRSKVFLRSGAVACLERERIRRLETAVVSIQALARGVSVRRSFKRVSRWVLLAQSRARGALLRRRLKERSDSIGTQYKLIEYYRNKNKPRQTFLHSLVRIQATIRRVLLERRLELERVLRSVISVQRFARGFLAREKYRIVRHGIILLQSCVRRRIAMRKYKDMKASRSVKRDSVDTRDWGLEKKIFQLQRKLSVKEQENTFLKRRDIPEKTGRDIPDRTGRGSLERSYSVRYTKPRGTNISGKEDKKSLKNELDLERKQRSLDSNLHREQVEQLRSSHREERKQLIGQIEQLTRQLESANQKELSESSMEFEILEKPNQYNSDEDLLRTRKNNRTNQRDLRESSPSGRSSGGIESGIDVSSVTLDQWDRARAELEAERDWISNILEKFSPVQLCRPLCDLLSLLAPQTDPPPPSLAETDRLQSLLQLIRDVTELRHDLSLSRPGRRDSLSCQAIPEECSVGHTTAPHSRAPSSLLTSSLTSSLLGQTDGDTECLLQQVSSLKLANQLLHRELETGLGEREEKINQKDSEINKLQQKIAALKSFSYGARSPMEAKLQQEVSRLTQENMDVTSELETLQGNFKTLQLTPSLPSSSPTVPIAKLPAAPSKRGLLLCPRDKERTLIRTLVQEMRPQRTAGLCPGLPAHLLFMALRSADERQDERQVESLLSDTIRSVRQKAREGRQDLHVLGFWLSNVSALIGDLKQFSGEDAYQVTNDEKQRKECLQNFDLTDFRYLFNELCVGLYHDLTTAIQDRIQHLIVPALLEHEAIPTVAMSRPSLTEQDARRSRGNSRRASSLLREDVTIRDLVRELSLILDVLRDMGVSPGCVKQLMRQVFYFINAVALNNILLRKDLCHWSRGLNIRYNISQLEEWTRSHAPLIDSRALDSLQPLTQAAQLLQINKKERDAADKICGVCADLSPLQIKKLLTMYTPANEFEERVPPSLIRAISQHFNLAVSVRPGDRPAEPKLMQDISLVYPPTFPYSPSSILLSQLEVPTHWELGFLRHL